MDWATVSYWWLRAHPKSPKTIDYKPHQKQSSLSIMSYLYTNFASFFKKIKIKILQNYVNVVHVKLGSLWEKRISLIYIIEICSVRTGLEEFLHWTEPVGIYGPSLPRLQYLKGFLPCGLNIHVECIFDIWLTKTKNVNLRIALCFYLSALTPLYSAYTMTLPLRCFIWEESCGSTC